MLSLSYSSQRVTLCRKFRREKSAGLLAQGGWNDAEKQLFRSKHIAMYPVRPFLSGPKLCQRLDLP